MVFPLLTLNCCLGRLFKGFCLSLSQGFLKNLIKILSQTVTPGKRVVIREAPRENERFGSHELCASAHKDTATRVGTLSITLYQKNCTTYKQIYGF